MGSNLSKIAIALYVLIGLVLVYTVSYFNISVLDGIALSQMYFVVSGFYLIGFGVLILLFREDVGYWTYAYKKWMAERFPMWAAISGMTYDELEMTWLSMGYSRKMVYVMAVVLIAMGVSFMILSPGFS